MIVLRIALLGSLAVALVLLAMTVPAKADRWRRLGSRIRSSTVAEREEAAMLRPAPGLPRGMPGLMRLAGLIEPVMAGAGTMELSFVLVAPGDEETGAGSWHGAGLLLYHFAPKVEPIVFLPLEMLRRWIEGSSPGTVHAGLLSWIDQREVFLFYDVPEAELGSLLGRMRERIGLDVLVRGRSADGRHHVLLLRSLVERIRRGDPDAQRYGALLP